MSIQHCRKKSTTKKIKLDEVDENISSIAVYKRLAILKYCNGNVDIKSKLDDFFLLSYFRYLLLFAFTIEYRNF